MPLIYTASTPRSVDSETISWAAPPFESSPSRIVGFVEDMIQEGEGYLEGLSAYKNLSQNLRVFDAIFRDKTKSALVTNKLKYDIRKFCETLAEVREIGTYGSDHPAYKSMAEMLTKVAKAVYLESDFPFQILKVLQYASVMGIGYLWPKIKASEYGYGERKLVFEALGLLDVVPVQVPQSNDVQDAYINTVFEYLPIAEAAGRFPLFQHLLQPVGKLNYTNRMQARRQDYAEMYRYGEQGRGFGNLYSEIRWTFIRDLRINTTGYELPMGDPETTWFYKVPFKGQQILGGFKDGIPIPRPAQNEDCRVYPNLRLIITSRGIDRPLYDGPAFDWDTKMPIIQYTVDDWAWEPGGRSLVGDVAPIQTTIRKHERKMDQAATVGLNPPLGYNMTETGGPKIEHFDVFEEDVRLGVDGEPNKTLQSILPAEIAVKEINFKWLEYLNNAMEQQLGLLDLGNISKMKMNVTSDGADKMLESIGPLAKGIAARIEKGNQRVGDRMKFLILQWFNVYRIMQYVGPQAVPAEVFDFNPDDLVPSHMPDEMLGNGDFPGNSSMYSRLDRARWFARNIRLMSVPNTLIKITQLQEQLKFLNLKQKQAPIPWKLVFEKLDIENPQKVIEDFYAEQVQMEKMQILAKIEVMKVLKELGIDPEALQGGGEKGGTHAGGRPSSNAKGPKIKQKGAEGGEPRTLISTSG